MWRSRLGLGVVMVALAWPAVLAGPAALASTSSVAVGGSSLQVSSLTVQAGQPTQFTVTFTAPATPKAQSAGVMLTLPTGWTAAPGSAQILNCTPCQLMSSSSTQVEVTVPPTAATMFGLELQVTPTAYASTGSFTAVEQYVPIAPFFRPAALPTVTSPLVTVSCPPDGLGSLTVRPASVPATTNQNFAFTYKAGACSEGESGVVTVTVPSQWTPPTGGPGPSGLVTSTDTASPEVTTPMITVPGGNLAAGTVITFEYQMAQAPASSVPYTFAAAEGPAGQQQPLASSPTVQVTAAVASSSPTPSNSSSSPTPSNSSSAPVRAGGAATMEVTPTEVTAAHPSTLRFIYTAGQASLTPSGEVTVQVPPGWTAPSRRPGQHGYTSVSSGRLTLAGRLITVTGVTLRGGQQLTITYRTGIAPAAAGVSTFMTSQRRDGTATLAALTTSPTVTVALVSSPHRPASWLPIILAVIGLVLLAGTAGLLAFRRLGRPGHGAGGGNVGAVPHTGPPPSVTVRDPGDHPALIVRIEPRVSATVTTIEERRP